MTKRQKPFKFIDLFAGIGGFHIAFHNQGGKCVTSCEIDRNARITYQHNFEKYNSELFNDGLFFEDVTKIVGKEIPDHDILCAGFPCQAFSIAGYRKGFEDERGNLFFDVARIIKTKQPKVVFLENVKNLKSHDKGNTFKTIEETLKELGYSVYHDVLNTFKYGNIPQNRERIYIVAFKDKEVGKHFSFPSEIDLTLNIKNLLDQNVDDYFYYEGKPLYKKIQDYVINENTAYQWRRKYVRENKKGVVPTLTANMGTGGHNVPIIKDNKGIRKLTPKECLRFQGYPDHYELPKLANGQLYKQIGNSVSVPVIERIAENILLAFKKSNNVL